MASNLPAYSPFKTATAPLPTKGGYTLLPTSLANQGAQLIPTSIAQGGAQLIDPNQAATMASTQFDQAIADAKAALVQQQADSAQYMSNVGNWYDQVLGAQNTATQREAALQGAVQNSEQGANAAVLASLGGGANSAGSSVAAAGQNNLGTLQALGLIQGNYNQDMLPLLQLAKSGALNSQQSENARNLGAAVQNVNDLIGQKGAAQANYGFQIADKNNAIRDTQQQRLLDILTANNTTRADRAKTLADIVGANNQTISNANNAAEQKREYNTTHALDVRNANTADTQGKIAAILAAGYDPTTGGLTKAASQSLAGYLGIPTNALTGTSASVAGGIVKNTADNVTKGYIATHKTQNPVIRGSASGGYFVYDPKTKTTTEIRQPVKGAGAGHTATPQEINDQIYKWRHGNQETVHNGDGSVSTQMVNALPYKTAYQALKTIYHMDDQSARAALDTQYGRGEQGRAWLTNEEQGALLKAGRQARVGFYQGHAFITKGMLSALKSAGQVPPGELVNGRYFIKPATHVAPVVAGQQ